jgi:ElaB/YqjD/DUF883 family membrane-anchored ribosome-binding protein
MPSIDERMGIVETKVQHITEKVDDLKNDVKDLHDCLDRTRDLLDKKLDDMLDEYRVNRDRYYQVLEDNKAEAAEAHKDLQASIKKNQDKLDAFEKFKTRGTYIAVAIAAFLAGTGYLTHGEVAKIIKLIAG